MAQICVLTWQYYRMKCFRTKTCLLRSVCQTSSCCFFFQGRGSHLRSLMPDIDKFLKLLLTLPASNATSERIFSGPRRLKTFIRSSMTQVRLNNTLILYVHRDNTDTIDLIEITNAFTESSEHRQILFGKFSYKSLVVKQDSV